MEKYHLMVCLVEIIRKGSKGGWRPHSEIREPTTTHIWIAHQPPLAGISPVIAPSLNLFSHGNTAIGQNFSRHFAMTF